MEPDIDERLERDGGNKEGKLLLVTDPEFPENGMDAGFSCHVGYDVQLERENGRMGYGCLGMGHGRVHTYLE